MLIRAGHSLASQCNPISHSGDLVQSVVVDVYFTVFYWKEKAQDKSNQKANNKTEGKNNCKREKCEVLKDEKQLTDSVKKQRLQQHQQLYNSTALRLCWIKSALPETAHTICTVVCCPCACHERKERKKLVKEPSKCLANNNNPQKQQQQQMLGSWRDTRNSHSHQRLTVSVGASWLTQKQARAKL